MKNNSLRLISALAAAVICMAALFSCSNGAPAETAAHTQAATEKETETTAVTEKTTEQSTEKYALSDGGRRFYFSPDGSDKNEGNSEFLQKA